MQQKERPILFSAPMVRAILEGQKTQTRRVIKSVAGMGPVTEFQPSDTPGYDFIMRDKRMIWNDLGLVELRQRCPYGGFGDRLWVRESWRVEECFDNISPSKLPKGEIIARHYEADGARVFWKYEHLPAGRLRPSIHMPRWASRIDLQIAGIRIERLQDISDEDAEAEGVDFFRHYPDADETLSASQLFMCLWMAINGDESWKLNPWVWVVNFKRS